MSYYYIGYYRPTNPGPTPPPGDSFIIQEDDFYILQEDGFKILQE